ncbi:MAG: hypothetical protein H0X51_04735 [Parachlamydiaceae bacterium]|nr:hypothetical protein [Parachlamydiaceae bacterium]
MKSQPVSAAAPKDPVSLAVAAGGSALVSSGSGKGTATNCSTCKVASYAIATVGVLAAAVAGVVYLSPKAGQAMYLPVQTPAILSKSLAGHVITPMKVALGLGGAVVGIAVGILVIAGLVRLVKYCCCCCRTKKEAAAGESGSTATGSGTAAPAKASVAAPTTTTTTAAPSGLESAAAAAAAASAAASAAAAAASSPEQGAETLDKMLEKIRIGNEGEQKTLREFVADSSKFKAVEFLSEKYIAANLDASQQQVTYDKMCILAVAVFTHVITEEEALLGKERTEALQRKDAEKKEAEQKEAPVRTEAEQQEALRRTEAEQKEIDARKKLFSTIWNRVYSLVQPLVISYMGRTTELNKGRVLAMFCYTNVMQKHSEKETDEKVSAAEPKKGLTPTVLDIIKQGKKSSTRENLKKMLTASKPSDRFAAAEGILNSLQISDIEAEESNKKQTKLAGLALPPLRRAMQQLAPTPSPSRKRGLTKLQAASPAEQKKKP